MTSNRHVRHRQFLRLRRPRETETLSSWQAGEAKIYVDTSCNRVRVSAVRSGGLLLFLWWLAVSLLREHVPRLAAAAFVASSHGEGKNNRSQHHACIHTLELLRVVRGSSHFCRHCLRDGPDGATDSDAVFFFFFCDRLVCCPGGLPR